VDVQVREAVVRGTHERTHSRSARRHRCGAVRRVSRHADPSPFRRSDRSHRGHVRAAFAPRSDAVGSRCAL
jgi:hypothetical protein